MEDNDWAGWEVIPKHWSSRVDSVEDAELAFRLQHASRVDPDLLKQLIDRYAVDIYRWVTILLYFQEKAEPKPEIVMRLLQGVFARVVSQFEQFHGQASLFSWLMAITYQAVKLPLLMEWSDMYHHLALPVMSKPLLPSWQGLESIPEKQRSIIILRYFFGLDLAQIGSVIGLQARETHRKLIHGIQRFLADIPQSEIDLKVIACVDGLWDDDPDALSRFITHLEECEVCRATLIRFAKLETDLTGSLRQRWEVVALDAQDLHTLYEATFEDIRQKHDGWYSKIKLNQVAWLLGMGVLFAGLVVLFVRLTPATDYPQAIITPTPPLPPVISMPPAIAPAQNGVINPQVPQYIAPAFSADGNWGVFTLINVGTNTQADLLSSVELYNRETNTVQTINKAAADLRIPWVYWDLAPGISGDGNFVVYVGATHDASVAGDACETATNLPCLDIFLYNRETGSTRRLSQAWGGGAANSDSLAPTISSDGKWVAFWSAADNLTPANGDSCQQANPGATCLNIYLVNLQNGDITMIPVGVIPGDVVFGVDRISLSADGRYVGFTATPSFHGAVTPGSTSSVLPNFLATSPSLTLAQPNFSSPPGQEPMIDYPPAGSPLTAIQQSSEAVIYDQQTGNYEFENQAPDGTPGNGPSSTPILSADGRYVAFVSASSNLVYGDYNKHSDVFVRDRQTGMVELVSISTAGRQGNDDSGITYWGRGFYSINLSSDGRYIVFESAATNLAAGASNNCARFDIPTCTLLYEHDRQTGTTELISTLSFSVLSHFPEISADGRWVSFMQFADQCLPTQNYCSNVMVYDRQNAWMANLTSFGEQSSSLPWNLIGSLTLPWQAWESSALSFSPDGKLLAVGGFDAKVRLWHITSDVKSINQDQPDMTLAAEGSDYFTTVAIAPDDGWLAAGTIKGVVDIWNLSSGNLLYTLNNQIDPIRKLEITPDGSHLIIATLAETWIWSIGDGSLVQETIISYGSSAVFALDITAQGNLLATARGDGTVWLQSLPGGELIGRLGGQLVTVDSLAFSPDGTMLAARSAQGTINIWQLASIGTPQPSFTLLSSVPSYMYVGALVFSPDNKYLAFTGMIGELALWSVPDGKIFTLSSSLVNEMVYGVSYSQANDMLAVLYEDQVGLWSFPPDYASTYYVRAGKDEFINTPPLPLSNANDLAIFNPYGASGMYSTIDQVAAASPFPIIVPTRLPENITFWDAMINLDGSVVLRYFTDQNRSGQSVLYIYEQQIKGAAPPVMTVGESAEITPLQIQSPSGGVLAEYVSGDWKLSENISAPKTGEMIGTSQDVWLWDDTTLGQRLRWQQNNTLVALYYQDNRYYTSVLSQASQTGNAIRLNPTIAESDLVQIANGMKLFDTASPSPASYTGGGASSSSIWPAEDYIIDQFCQTPYQASENFWRKFICT